MIDVQALLRTPVVACAGLPRAQIRVVVAMSGGVDSSVVAALLKQQGFDVVGITLQLYNSGAARSRKGACCAGQDIADARAVADHIGIPHYVLDYERRFADSVIGAFADSYAAGETPVPCVLCNQTVKFTDLLAVARQLGAAALATGHYIVREEDGRDGILRRAADSERDQSYFLFATTREQLAFLRFPLGPLRKSAVRALAEEWKLPVAAKPDSQDICFVPSGHYADLLAKLRPEACEPGEIVDTAGRHLGEHQGIARFTIGQRRGLGIATGEPVFVKSLDPARRRVVVGPRSALHTRSILLRNVNWLGEGEFVRAVGCGLAISVRIRSTQAPQAATLLPAPDDAAAETAPDTAPDSAPDRARVELVTGAYGVSPGQACVFYDGDGDGARVLGGGWIDRTVAGA